MLGYREALEFYRIATVPEAVYWTGIQIGPVMKKSIPAPDPDAYVSALAGWQRACVEDLRSAATSAARTEEKIKWGHLVYFSNGPVFIIRVEEHRVLFGFWRGQRLSELESRLKPGGKYEMATIELHEGDSVLTAVVRRLVKAAVALNKNLGDPTDLGKN